MKRKTSFIALLILSLSVFATASGCGKKGPPLPPEEEKSLTEGQGGGQPAELPNGQTSGKPYEAPSKNP